jgi:hypothetical protein
MCNQDEGEHDIALVPSVECDKCHRLFRWESCYSEHFNYICKKSWKCRKCLKNYPYSRSLAAHVCGEVFCKVCDDFVDPNHECYHRPAPAKPNLDPTKFRFFDFECDISGEYHIPNYAVVSVDGGEFTTYSNHGHGIIDQFCQSEFTEVNRGCCFVAINSKGKYAFSCDVRCCVFCHFLS